MKFVHETYMDDWIDEHIRLVRLIPWCIGSVGVYLIIKHNYMFTRFKNAASIPNKLIVTNRKLLGRVVKCSDEKLGVWHIPLGYRLLRWKTHPPTQSVSDVHTDLIYIRLAGVTVTDNELAQKWLEANLLNQIVKFVLLHQDQEHIECIVKKTPSRVSVNELLLTKGLATVCDVQGFHSNHRYVSFVSRLIGREAIAKKRGSGMWEGSEHEKLRWKLWRKLKKMFLRK